MNVIAYCQPFVPPEWIAAHGLRPQWLRPQTAASSGCGGRRGVCPAAAALIDAAQQGDCPDCRPTDAKRPGAKMGLSPSVDMSAAALVLTTTCDQMRYAAAAVEAMERIPIFLMHVPRTWQPPAARGLYGEELRRLGRFLVRCGGELPTPETLRQVMVRYDEARAELRRRRTEMSAREFAAAVAAVRGCLDVAEPASPASPHPDPLPEGEGDRVGHAHPTNLALVGGPMSPGDDALLDLIERAGGRVVLDATETGERTLPAPFRGEQLDADPFEELVAAYFDAIPDVFRRPNDRLYAWIGREVAGRRVRGLLVRRYVWCDLWHAELARLRQESAVPVLEWDVVGEDCAAAVTTPSTRDTGRLEAFLEMLR